MQLNLTALYLEELEVSLGGLDLSGKELETALFMTIRPAEKILRRRRRPADSFLRRKQQEST
jgi:hypothetical protein